MLRLGDTVYVTVPTPATPTGEALPGVVTDIRAGKFLARVPQAGVSVWLSYDRANGLWNTSPPPSPPPPPVPEEEPSKEETKEETHDEHAPEEPVPDTPEEAAPIQEGHNERSG